MKRNVAKAGQPWEPGLTPNAMRKHLTELGKAAAERIQAQATKEASLDRVVELEALARQVAAISPHPLRHGLAYRMWKTASPAHIQTILGHSRVATALRYGKPTEDDRRAAIQEASRIRSREGEYMANPEHLAILRQGVAVWNARRQEDLLVEPQRSISR